MNKNISWDLNGGQSLEEFWGDNRGPVERREDRGAMIRILQGKLGGIVLSFIGEGRGH